MGTYNGGPIQYGYNFEILNTFEMGHLKKTCSHIPSQMDLSQTPGGGGGGGGRRHEMFYHVLNGWMGRGGGGQQVSDLLFSHFVLAPP